MKNLLLIFPAILIADVEINDSSQNSQGLSNIQVQQEAQKGVINIQVNDPGPLPPPGPAPFEPSIVIDEEDSRFISSDIDLRARARDFVETFNQIKEDDPDAKIYAIINGASLSRLTNVETTKGETLLRFYYKSGRKIRVKTVRVEEVEEINYW